MAVEGYYPIAILLFIAAAWPASCSGVPRSWHRSGSMLKALAPMSALCPRSATPGTLQYRFLYHWHGVYYLRCELPSVSLGGVPSRSEGPCFLGMAIFLVIIALSLVYAGKRGALHGSRDRTA